jgi:peroxiredoxin
VQLLLFQGTLADIREAGATLVAISPQTPTRRCAG